MVKQHSFDCSTIRFTSQKNCSFFFWTTSIRCRRPMQVEVFFYNHSRVRFLSRCPKQLNRTFWMHNFFTIDRSETEHWQILLFCKEFGIFFAVIWPSDIFFSHTHTHTHNQRITIKDPHTHTHTHTIQSFFYLLFLFTSWETKSCFSFFS